MSTSSVAPRPELPSLDRLRLGTLVVGVVGLVVCGVAALFEQTREQCFRAYLIAFLFVLGLSLGSMAVLMMQFLTGGAWGLAVRRLLETATRTVPLVALLFVPLLFGIRTLYQWADPEAVANDPVLRWKEPYLNVPFFVVRAVVYFAVWIGMALLLTRWSREQDRADVPGLPRRFRMLSAPGLVVYGLTITFAAIDWGMSLSPHWFSTIYGVIIGTGQVLSGFCFAVVVAVLLAPATPLAGLLAGGRIRDLGNLMLAFLMLWAYMAFSQFLLVYSANLRVEVPWYVDRMNGGWQYVGGALIVVHFALPFLLLLSRDLKNQLRRVAAVAVLLLVMRFVDLYYLIAPSVSPESPPLPWLWLDAAALVGVGGVWLAFYLWQLPRLPLVPPHDPRVLEANPHG